MSQKITKSAILEPLNLKHFQETRPQYPLVADFFVFPFFSNLVQASMSRVFNHDSDFAFYVRSVTVVLTKELEPRSRKEQLL